MKLGCYELGPNDTPENGIYCGDARLLAKAIPDESVDLIFTDPVYQNIDDYRWLAEMGVRTLRENRALLAFCGIGWLPETLNALQESLRYRWRLIVRPVWSKEFHGRLCVMTQECLWFEKGNSQLHQTQFDFQYSTRKGSYSVGGANWGKGMDCLSRWIRAFTEPGAIVFDPFSGSASVSAVCKMLGRQYLAFEIDPTTCELARERVRNTQPPLFVPQEQQLAMGV